MSVKDNISVLEQRESYSLLSVSWLLFLQKLQRFPGSLLVRGSQETLEEDWRKETGRGTKSLKSCVWKQAPAAQHWQARPPRWRTLRDSAGRVPGLPYPALSGWVFTHPVLSSKCSQREGWPLSFLTHPPGQQRHREMLRFRRWPVCPGTARAAGSWGWGAPTMTRMPQFPTTAVCP